MATAKEKPETREQKNCTKPRPQTGSRRSRGNSRRRSGETGLLLSRTSKLSARCVESFRNGIASKLFCSADRTDEAFRNGFGARLLQSIGFRETVSGPLRKEIAAGAENSPLFALAERIRRGFLHTRARFFGIAGIVFALYTTGIFLTKRYVLPGIGTAEPADLCTAAVTLLISLLLLFCGRPINTFCANSVLFKRAFIDTLGFCPEDLRQGNERVSAHGGIAFVVGTLMGLATVWFTPHRVLFFLFATLFCLCIPASPETGLLSAVFLLPFAPLRATGFLTLLALVGYLQKYFRLKRAFRARLPECLMLMTVGVCGLSALTGGDSSVFLRMSLFGCLWMLATCLLSTEKLFRAYHAALVFGGIATLLLSALRLSYPLLAGLLPTFLPEWSLLQSLTGDLFRSGLANDVLGCYLVVLLPVALARGKCRSGVAALCLIAVNAVLLRSPWTLMGLFLALLLYAAFAHGALAGAALAGCAGFPTMALLMEERLGNIASGFSLQARLLAQKYFFTGVGAGDAALTAAALANGMLPDGFTAGLYTRLVLDGGVVALLLFVGSAFCALQRLFTCMRETTNRRRMQRFGGIAAASVLFLFVASVTNVWADLRMLGIFWCLCPAASLTGDLYGYQREREAWEEQWI